MNLHPRWTAVAALAASTLLGACSGGAQKVAYLKAQADIPHFVAILPPDNESTDLAAPDTTRRAVAEMALGLGMIPVCTPAQDEQLRRMGLTEGGQLKAFKAADLAKALGVDGLLVPVIRRFTETNIGVYVNRLVEAQVTLLDKNGDRLWQIEGTGYNRAFNISPSSIAMEAGKAMAQQVVGSQLEKMLKIHLLAEAQKMTGLMRPRLPDWPKSDKPGVDGLEPSPGSKRGGAAGSK